MRSPRAIEGHGRVELGGQFVEVKAIILGFSIPRRRDGFEMTGVTLLHDVGKILVAGQTITGQHAAEVRPQGVEVHILAATLFRPIGRSERFRKRCPLHL